MKKVFGEWVMDIEMNKFQLVVLRALIYKRTPVTGDELRYIRKYFCLSLVEFGKIFGVTHVAVLKWENGERKINPALEFYLRLYVLEYLHANDKEFRNLYNKISLEDLKNKAGKIQTLVIDVNEGLKIA